MAKNTNKRVPVKWVRDAAKNAYEKKDRCAICDTTIDLELHHTHSITILLNDWARRNNYDISTDAGILAVRDIFIEEHLKEIYDDVFTLCNPHHVKLHGVYGKAPSNLSAPKQVIWIATQREKFFNPDSKIIKANPILGGFGKFYESQITFDKFY